MPYKTLLLSVRETAAYVVREMLDKYALTREDPLNYCLVQVTGGQESSEYILEDDECPLSILMNHTGAGNGRIDPLSAFGVCVERARCFFNGC